MTMLVVRDFCEWIPRNEGNAMPGLDRSTQKNNEVNN